jgi:phage terminase large subunit
MTMKVPTAEVFEPLLQPARYKGAKGGRGSGKSHFFAGLLVDDHYRNPGHRSICIREVQKTLNQSSKQTIEDKIQSMGLGAHFEIRADRIISRGNGVIMFQGMQDHSAESIKSLEGFNCAWIEEAQTLSARSLSLLRPTIRAGGSEIWASWNPTRKQDAIDEFFCGPKGLPGRGVMVTANWRDNPWWNEVLEAERKLELERYPERYAHTYEGEYASAFEGAYFASLLTEARLKGRIGHVEADPLLPLRAFIDIGGSGARADAFTIWVVQWVGEVIKILDYYESVGQVLAYHVNWLRERGYKGALLYLPHDGVNENNVTGKRYEDHLREAGFHVEPPIANQGKGAASMRIEAVRRIGPKMWFNESTTESGRQALGFYHERKDEQRNVGLGPDHDWSSHCADAFGLMAVAYEIPAEHGDMMPKFNRYRGGGGWQGA